MINPVYPKEDPEYRKRVMEEFYRKVRETNWNEYDGEYKGKPRGRKPKPKQGPPPDYYKPKQKKHDNFKNYVSLTERNDFRKKS